MRQPPTPRELEEATEILFNVMIRCFAYFLWWTRMARGPSQITGWQSVSLVIQFTRNLCCLARLTASSFSLNLLVDFHRLHSNGATRP
jgi:hypothetical protein